MKIVFVCVNFWEYVCERYLFGSWESSNNNNCIINEKSWKFFATSQQIQVLKGSLVPFVFCIVRVCNFRSSNKIPQFTYKTAEATEKTASSSAVRQVLVLKETQPKESGGSRHTAR